MATGDSTRMRIPTRLAGGQARSVFSHVWPRLVHPAATASATDTNTDTDADTSADSRTATCSSKASVGVVPTSPPTRVATVAVLSGFDSEYCAKASPSMEWLHTLLIHSMAGGRSAPLIWWLTPSRAIYMVKVCQRPCNSSASLNYRFRNVLFPWATKK